MLFEPSKLYKFDARNFDEKKTFQHTGFHSLSLPALFNVYIAIKRKYQLLLRVPSAIEINKIIAGHLAHNSKRKQRNRARILWGELYRLKN